MMDRIDVDETMENRRVHRRDFDDKYKSRLSILKMTYETVL